MAVMSYLYEVFLILLLLFEEPDEMKNEFEKLSRNPTIETSVGSKQIEEDFRNRSLAQDVSNVIVTSKIANTRGIAGI